MTEPEAEAAKASEDAFKIAYAIEDLGERQFALRALTIASLNQYDEKGPSFPFDMMYFLRVIRLLYEQKTELQRVLAGEDLRWWADH